MRYLHLLLLALACTAIHAGDLPLRLSDTGYGSADMLAFSPQYPLWSDGTGKRRWILLPADTRIDARDPGAWEFPVGTRLFKEFSYGRPIETRVIERRADGSWQFSVYIWNEAGTEALLAPPEGIAALPVPAAPGGRYAVPSRSDCLACHEGARVPVLGFSALQLSPDRDPLAPHADAHNALDLRELKRRGLVTGLPETQLKFPPRIAAASPLERAALGYLHGNCGHCHGDSDAFEGAVPVGLQLSQNLPGHATSIAALDSMVGATSRFRPTGGALPTPIVEPGNSSAGVLPLRLGSRNPRLQMPPLGTTAVDAEGLALVLRWIDSLPTNPSNHRSKE
jgi:hypothetical protein